MDYRYLEAFLAVSKHLSFSSAAKELHISVSAVSRQILLFEESVEGEVFFRNTRRVGLTPLGSRLYAAALRLEGEVKQDQPSPLKVGLLQSVFDSFLLGVLKKNPALMKEGLSIQVGSPETLERKLIDEKLDLVLTNRAPKSAEFESRRLYRETLAWVSPARTSPGAGRRMLIWSAIGELSERLNPYSEPALEVSSLNAVVEMVRAGLGEAILPIHAAGGLDSDLRVRPLTATEVKRAHATDREVNWIYLVTRVYRSLPKREAAVIKVLSDVSKLKNLR